MGNGDQTARATRRGGELDVIAEKVFPLHRKAVEGAVGLLADSLGWSEEERRASLVRVASFYDGTPWHSRAITCHADPYDSACDFAPTRIEYGDRMGVFEGVREAYGAMMAGLDDAAGEAFRRGS